MSLEERVAKLEERTANHADSDRDDFASVRTELDKLWRKLDSNSRVLLGVLVTLIINLLGVLIGIAVVVITR